jgi:Tripartite tricarboxylate transporter TctB family
MSNDDQLVAAGRVQQIAAAAGILGIGLWVGYVSFMVDDARPYLFPQLIAVAMIGLASFALIRAIRGANRTGTGISQEQLLMIIPALALMLVYVFVLIPLLGFYSAATIAFFVLYSLYDPNSHRSPRTWLMRIIVTAGFMALIYLIFAVGLRVQTPRGIFI